MVEMTQSFEQWLFKYYRKEFTLICFGRTGVLTPEMQKEYIEWCKTDEGKQYLKGGSLYDENHEGNKAIDETVDEGISKGITTMTDELKPCPFCGGKIRIVVCDYEGNIRDTEYEKDPWSGLGYLLYHDIIDVPDGEECPIAGRESERALGRLIYDTREEAIKVWNRRVDNDR